MCAQRTRGILKITNSESRGDDQRLKEGSGRKRKIAGEPTKGDRQEPQDSDTGKNETSKDDRAERGLSRPQESRVDCPSRSRWWRWSGWAVKSYQEKAI